MEETLKDDSSSATAKVGKSASKLLRYPLRSASKPKEDKLPLTDASNSSAPRSRSQVTPNVSRSVSVLDLSGKEKSAKPPRRQSILSKSSVAASPSSNSKLAGNVTPISGARPKKNPVKGDTTPVSDSLNRRKFSVLSSASYWVSQIKVSEAASKHSISLGFFRLALDAGCEPLQILRDELKAYTRRHNLAQFGEQVKDLLASYNILEEFEQLQVSESCSNVPEDETRSSDDDIRSKAPNAKDTNKKEKTAKNESVAKPSRSGNINVVKAKQGSKSGENSQPKQRKPESRKGCAGDSLEKKGKTNDEKDMGLVKSPVVEHELQENKENMDAGKTEELNQSEF